MSITGHVTAQESGNDFFFASVFFFQVQWRQAITNMLSGDARGIVPLYDGQTFYGEETLSDLEEATHYAYRARVYTGDPTVCGDVRYGEWSSWDYLATDGADPMAMVDFSPQEQGDDIFSLSGLVNTRVVWVLPVETGSDISSVSGAVAIAGSMEAQEIGADETPLTARMVAQEVGSDIVPLFGAMQAQEQGLDFVVPPPGIIHYFPFIHAYPTKPLSPRYPNTTYHDASGEITLTKVHEISPSTHSTFDGLTWEYFPDRAHIRIDNGPILTENWSVTLKFALTSGALEKYPILFYTHSMVIAVGYWPSWENTLYLYVDYNNQNSYAYSGGAWIEAEIPVTSYENHKHLIVVTCEAGVGLRFYVDNEEVGNSLGNVRIPWLMLDGSYNPSIGPRNLHSYTRQGGCHVADVAVYDEVLSSPQRDAIWNGGNFLQPIACLDPEIKDGDIFLPIWAALCDDVEYVLPDELGASHSVILSDNIAIGGILKYKFGPDVGCEYEGVFSIADGASTEYTAEFDIAERNLIAQSFVSGGANYIAREWLGSSVGVYELRAAHTFYKGSWQEVSGSHAFVQRDGGPVLQSISFLQDGLAAIGSAHIYQFNALIEYSVGRRHGYSIPSQVPVASAYIAGLEVPRELVASPSIFPYTASALLKAAYTFPVVSTSPVASTYFGETAAAERDSVAARYRSVYSFESRTTVIEYLVSENPNE